MQLTEQLIDRVLQALGENRGGFKDRLVERGRLEFNDGATNTRWMLQIRSVDITGNAVEIEYINALRGLQTAIDDGKSLKDLYPEASELDKGELYLFRINTESLGIPNSKAMSLAQDLGFVVKPRKTTEKQKEVFPMHQRTSHSVIVL